MKSEWQIPEISNESILQLSNSLKIPSLVAKILITRGYEDSSSAQNYLFPKLSNLQSPQGIKSFYNAIERVAKAIKQKERIGIYGDYDVDGISSSTILAMALKKLGTNGSIWLADRFASGYGLDINTILKIKDKQISLLITVDCGTSDIEAIKEAQKAGIEVIVIDHHELKGDPPPTKWFINPKGNPDNFLYKNLASVGLVFYFVAALISYLSAKHIDSKQFLDLVALGTVADVAPLINSNRILVKTGLNKLNKECNIGLDVLKKISGIKENEEITSFHISYRLAPRINAAGRIGKAQVALALLMSGSKQEAEKWAASLEKLTKLRQEIDKKITLEIESIIHEHLNDPILILSSPDWHYGVLGIIASRLCEKHNKPVILLTEETSGFCRGSARFPDGFHAVNILNTCSEFLHKFGGHEGAAGLTIEKNKIDLFKKSIIDEIISNHNETNQYYKIDAEADLNEININSLKFLELFSPFGEGNPEPIVLFKDLKIIDQWILKDEHTKLKVSDNNGKYIDVFAPRNKDFINLNNGSNISILGNPRINRYDNKEKAEILLIDWF